MIRSYIVGVCTKKPSSSKAFFCPFTFLPPALPLQSKPKEAVTHLLLLTSYLLPKMEPKYKVNPLTGELQEYIFEYNGILALRNFTAKVEDERLILHAADDVNFSILEALVSEVEINGVVYDNPTAAQEALTRLTFNQNRPVLLDKSLKELILNAVQKVEGKGLSSNDFTNAYKQQLDALEDYDIELDESTTELKFKKGNNVVRRISLMFLDDEGTKLVYNRTSKTLELRDKRDNLLTSIPVSHFVSNIPTGIVIQNGKIKLMAGSEVIDENAISYNDLADKPNLNFAPANHTHNWNDIDGKPNFDNFFEEKMQNGYKIEASKLNDFAFRPSGSYVIKYGNDDWGGLLLVFRRAGASVSSLEFLMNHYYYGTRLKVRHSIDGNRYAGDFKELAWWEDVVRAGVECTQNITLQKEHQNQTLFVTVPCNIELNAIDDLSSVSFRKVFDSGVVSFSCTGKNIIYTSDNQFNGKKGSTAVISRYGNDCYIDIRNI